MLQISISCISLFILFIYCMDEMTYIHLGQQKKKNLFDDNKVRVRGIKLATLSRITTRLLNSVAQNVNTFLFISNIRRYFQNSSCPCWRRSKYDGKNKSSGTYIIRKTSRLLDCIILFFNKHCVLIIVVSHMEEAMKIFYEVVSSITWKGIMGSLNLV